MRYCHLVLWQTILKYFVGGSKEQVVPRGRSSAGLVVYFAHKSCLFQWPSLFACISQRANLSGRSVRHASKNVEECSNNRPCVTCNCVRTALVGLYFSYHLTWRVQVCSTSVTNVVTPVLFGTGNLLWKASEAMISRWLGPFCARPHTSLLWACCGSTIKILPFSAIYFTRTKLRLLKILLGYAVLSPCIVTNDLNIFRWRF
jgi:hypothetical protein